MQIYCLGLQICLQEIFVIVIVQTSKYPSDSNDTTVLNCQTYQLAEINGLYRELTH